MHHKCETAFKAHMIGLRQFQIWYRSLPTSEISRLQHRF